MTKTKRTIAFVLAVAMLITVVFCVAFMAMEAQHGCLREDCQICAQIAVVRDVLKALFCVALAAAITVAFTYAGQHCVAYLGRSASKGTLVALKIELLN